ncbi:MAG: hypothetical protein U1F43_38975 [Myxococcota bacterium]
MSAARAGWSLALGVAGVVGAVAGSIACGDGARATRRSRRAPRPRARPAGGRRPLAPDIDPRWRMRGGILWSAPGQAALLDERGVVGVRPEGRFDLDVYAPPPDRFLRSAARGAVALGQVVFYADRDGDGRRSDGDGWLGGSDVLVAWSPGGAGGGLVVGELPAGLSLVRASAPCDVAPLLVHATRPHDPLAVSVLPDQPSSVLFSDAGCAAALDDDHAVCQSLSGTRWWCRYGPASGDLCARCEHLVFPVDATSAVCDAWYQHCATDLRQRFREPECWSEWRLCTAGEPPPLRSCDLECACDQLAAYCDGTPDPAMQCPSELAGCDWREGP